MGCISSSDEQVNAPTHVVPIHVEAPVNEVAVEMSEHLHALGPEVNMGEEGVLHQEAEDLAGSGSEHGDVTDVMMQVKGNQDPIVELE